MSVAERENLRVSVEEKSYGECKRPVLFFLPTRDPTSGHQCKTFQDFFPGIPSSNSSLLFLFTKHQFHHFS